MVVSTYGDEGLAVLEAPEEEVTLQGLLGGDGAGVSGGVEGPLRSVEGLKDHEGAVTVVEDPDGAVIRRTSSSWCACRSLIHRISVGVSGARVMLSCMMSLMGMVLIRCQIRG